MRFLNVLAGAAVGALAFGIVTFGAIFGLFGGFRAQAGSLPAAGALFFASWSALLGAGLGGWWMLTRE